MRHENCFKHVIGEWVLSIYILKNITMKAISLLNLSLARENILK